MMGTHVSRLVRLAACCVVMTPCVSGCGNTSVTSGSLEPPAFSGSSRDAVAFTKLHDFANGSDGAYPNVGFIESGGLLYATTAGGGPSATGTVYQTSAGGNEKVLLAFDGGDGGNPNSDLVADGDELYGTADDGGANGDGVVFVITKHGKERVLHSFSGTDGATPAAGLVNVHGVFYGTTEYGGAYNYGTIFKITPNGSESVVYSFGSKSADGLNPSATLTLAGNKLYGTTQSGGAFGGGTVFSASISGKESTLYSFGSGNEGKDPYLSTATLFHGLLYGTTAYAGTHGQGAVFAVNPKGGGDIIYNFGDSSNDGAYCASGVIVYRNGLYGTCYGASSGSQGDIFRIFPSGKETILYSFTGSDGAGSLGRLKAVGDYFYGTLSLGGAYGVGTIFRYKI
jgi:uncharacterized repeat protein (TIGR03803 family)